MNKVKLTQYSHGAGCGCKIAPNVLENILAVGQNTFVDPQLLVGNLSRDDAAVYDIGDGNAIISTTDFFMPIVDEPYDFGQIASINAISDVYAMGGKPIMAIAILGWPVDKIPAEIAKEVLEGSRAACQKAGIALGGGHSIDSPEPIFGLAVTGRVQKRNLKRNDEATEGCQLYLTKPLGVGTITTAQKKGLVEQKDLDEVIKSMTTLNVIGATLGELPYVKALTDVTGFGLLGHLCEMCEGSGLSSVIYADKVPQMERAKKYIELGCIPGGTNRNWDSYGHKIGPISEFNKSLLCDPQTSGGLLIAAEDSEAPNLQRVLQDNGLPAVPFGKLIPQKEKLIFIE